MHKGKVEAVRCCTATYMARRSKVARKTKSPVQRPGFLFCVSKSVEDQRCLALSALSAIKWTVHGTHLTRV